MNRSAAVRRLPGLAGDLALLATSLGFAVLILASALDEAPLEPSAASAPGLIEHDPLDLAALRDLGLDLDHQGRSAEADAILSFVGHRTWRDGPTEVWLLRRRLAQNRFDEAFESADSLLRRDGDGTTRPALFPMFVAAARYAQARPALEARLVGSPWWRQALLQELAARGDIDGARSVFADLAAGKTPPSPQEYAPLIDRLVDAKDYGGALSAWKTLSRRTDPVSPDLRDGNFTGIPDQTAFTWSAASGVGAISVVDATSGGAAGRTLRVDYDGFSSPTLPAQLLVLQPGRYRVTWRERLDRAASAPLYWRVRCGDTGQVLVKDQGAAEMSGGASEWRSMRMDFETPKTGCAGQWLELTANPGDRRDPVTARYASFRVEAAP